MRERTYVSLVLALIACGGDRGAPHDASVPDAAIAHDAAPDAAPDAEVDAASPSFSDAMTPPPPSVEPPDAPEDPCALGSTIGAGIMSGTLEGEEPVMTATVTLDRFEGAVPSVLSGITLPVPTRLEHHGSGMIATSEHGFFDIEAKSSALFHPVRSTLATPAAHAGDLDGDGDDDVVAMGLRQIGDDDETGEVFLNPFVMLFERGEDGVLRQRARAGAEYLAESAEFVLGDHDGDGDLDVLAVDLHGTPFAFRNDGDFALVATPLAAEGSERFVAQELLAEDRNGDGAIDLVAFGWVDAGDQARVYTNDGSGAYASPTISAYVRGSSRRAFGDVTGDGLADLVFFDFSEQLHVAPSLNGNGFADPIALGQRTHGFTLGDVDGDGVLEIAAYSFQGTALMRTVGDTVFEEHAYLRLPAQWLQAIAIESATDEPARLHALYHANCRKPCGEGCNQGCIFEACVECIAHSDCSADRVCVSGSCTPR